MPAQTVYLSNFRRTLKRRKFELKHYRFIHSFKLNRLNIDLRRYKMNKRKWITILFSLTALASL